MAEVIDFESLPLSGRSSRVFEGMDRAPVSFFLVDLAPGEGPDPHKHPYDEVFVVQEGSATFTVGGEAVVVHAGHIVIGPANVVHSFVNSGTTRLRTVNIHPSPTMLTDWVDSA